jgi:hypothetical protein
MKHPKAFAKVVRSTRWETHRFYSVFRVKCYEHPSSPKTDAKLHGAVKEREATREAQGEHK